jgi:hypothetical protein
MVSELQNLKSTSTNYRQGSEIQASLIMKNRLINFSNLRKMLLFMEQDLGVADLTNDEKNLLAAITDQADNSGEFRSELVRTHSLVVDMSHGTFFRSLKKLIEKNIILKSSDKRRSIYRLNADFPQASE